MGYRSNTDHQQIAKRKAEPWAQGSSGQQDMQPTDCMKEDRNENTTPIHNNLMDHETFALCTMVSEEKGETETEKS